MVRYLFFACVFAFLILAPGISLAQQAKYSKVKIYADREGLAKLAEQGVAFDHGDAKQDVYFISDFSARDVEIIRKSGFKYEIMIDDVSAYYARQNSEPEPEQAVTCSNSFIKTPTHFHMGSYAGFFTYTEMLNILDSMQLLYPSLISKKAPVDNTTSWQGKPVYWVRISNKPNVDQLNKPELFYNALHHAREAVTLSQIIYYMWYLLDNYNTDPEVKGIVDNLEMYFIPCINPDGYIYNQTTNPAGGGMQRKNMRSNPDGSKGVDLNRNYDQFWGYDNQGSSNSQGADNYRGPSAASEPETKMIKNFCLSHEFKLALSCHSYGKYFIHAWGYKANTFPSDNSKIEAYGKFMTQENQYKVGTPNQTVGYTGNGASTDWFYAGTGLKNEIIEYSPEAGGGSFYPAKNQIIPVCQELFYSDYKLAKLALKYVIAYDKEPFYVNATSGYFNYQYKSLVPDTMAKFTISIIPLSPVITAVGNPKNYNNTVLNASLSDSIPFTLNTSVTQGTLLKYIVKVSNGIFTHSDTVQKMYGHPLVAFAENGNSINQWITSTGWGLSTTVYHSPSSSITDSPNGNYANNANSSIQTKNSINLIHATSALLTFWTQWNIESGFDYAQISASADSGQTWVSLCGKYTSTGTAKQDPGNPIYDGSQGWVQEQISLDNFLERVRKVK